MESGERNNDKEMKGSTEMPGDRLQRIRRKRPLMFGAIMVSRASLPAVNAIKFAYN